MTRIPTSDGTSITNRYGNFINKTGNIEVFSLDSVRVWVEFDYQNGSRAFGAVLALQDASLLRDALSQMIEAVRSHEKD